MKRNVPRLLRLLGLSDIRTNILILFLSVGVYMTASHYDAFEMFGAFLRRHENIELDEFFYVVLILFLFSSINVVIRGAKLEREVNRRRLSEKKLVDMIEEKDLLMKEFQHRVKNNLQIMNSMIELKRRMNPQKELEPFFTDIMNRIYSMSVVHDRLKTDGIRSSVELSAYIQDMAQKIIYNAAPDAGIAFMFKSVPVEIDVKKGIYCWLIFNELLTNTIKYAFPGGWEGECRISITLSIINGTVYSSYRDTGIGLGKQPDISGNESMGFMLISTLINKQLRGEYSLPLCKGFGIDFSFPV